MLGRVEGWQWIVLCHENDQSFSACIASAFPHSDGHLVAHVALQHACCSGLDVHMVLKLGILQDDMCRRVMLGRHAAKYQLTVCWTPVFGM